MITIQLDDSQYPVVLRSEIWLDELVNKVVSITSEQPVILRWQELSVEVTYAAAAGEDFAPALKQAVKSDGWGMVKVA